MKRNNEIVKVGIFGIYINSVLVMFKAIIGFLSGSIAIVLDAVNNLSDILSSLIIIIGSKLSTKKPDKEHPFGHGRIEYFAAILISSLILFAGISCLTESIDKIVNPKTAEYSFIALVFLILAIFSKILLSKYLKIKGKDLSSKALIASGLDAMWDSIITLSTLIAALVSIFFEISIEGYIGVGISVLIIKSGIEIFKSSIDDMIGMRADDRLIAKLKRRILSYEEVLGVHDIGVHNYGPNNIIATAYIDVLEKQTAKDIHRLTRLIEQDVLDRYDIELTLGIYATNKEEEYLEIKKYLYKITKEYDSIVEVHGFYVDKELKQISFDIAFDFNEENQDKIVKEIKKTMKEKYNKYDYEIIIDRDI